MMMSLFASILLAGSTSAGTKLKQPHRLLQAR
jgi:hypothetical protein